MLWKGKEKGSVDLVCWLCVRTCREGCVLFYLNTTDGRPFDMERGLSLQK